ncbi:MAG TPA: hypothetical protein PLD05_05845, partial [Thermogutta sp.]|nr:hypothetical protein [Thermogutta sp.]
HGQAQGPAPMMDGFPGRLTPVGATPCGCPNGPVIAATSWAGTGACPYNVFGYFCDNGGFGECKPIWATI